MRISTIQSVAITGVKGVGKTTVGKRLAALWKVPFFDTDDCIVNHFRTETLSHRDLIESARDVYVRTGPDVFRQMELRAIESTRKEPFHVLSVGGGIADNQPALACLRKSYRVISLIGDPEEQYARIVRSGIPPFLGKDNPKGKYLALAERRAATYKRECDFSVDASDKNVDEIVTQIDELIGEKHHGG